MIIDDRHTTTRNELQPVAKVLEALYLLAFAHDLVFVTPPPPLLLLSKLLAIQDHAQNVEEQL